MSRRRNGKTPPAPSQTRCAIYTRKSTEEGLAQEFNSLDAQREAAEAFIASQRHEGWVALPDRYDDGGFSGGNMDRPALRRLLADVEARRVDAIVVYKVDRLSRSLLDFARIMETLERGGCSFVSVTQQFNTTHSMGRLTLNILLSFAQFEREIISERTRDKMSAARRRGKWVGGSLILGYDLNPERTALVVNPAEADAVRAIFDLYLEKRSVLGTATELNRRGWPRKRWESKGGRACGGGLWNKPNLLALLTNVTYVGKVNYGGQIYAGEHEAILDEGTWTAAQAMLTRNARDRGAAVRSRHGALLRGLLRCGSCGASMTHSYTQRRGVRYRYYICQTAMKRGYAECATKSVPAQQIEQFVLQRVGQIGRDPRLAAAVANEARAEHSRKSAALADEKARIVRSMRDQARTVATVVGEPNAAARLAELEDQLRAGENRLSEIAVEVARLGPAEVREGDVAAALERFSELAGTLSMAERARLLELLVQQVTFNRAKGTVAITFRPHGFEAVLAEEASL